MGRGRPSRPRPGDLDLSGLTGASREELEARLGPPDTEREAGGERWCVYRQRVGTLRVRLAGTANRAGSAAWRVASWTMHLEPGSGTLREAAEAVGLWPACGPDVAAAEVRPPPSGGPALVRRALGGETVGRVGTEGKPGNAESAGEAGAPGKAETAGHAEVAGNAGAAGDAETALRSFTAEARAGRFVRLAVFDEAPDWL